MIFPFSFFVSACQHRGPLPDISMLVYVALFLLRGNQTWILRSVDIFVCIPFTTIKMQDIFIQVRAYIII